MHVRIPLGTGYYTRAEGARLLKIHPATLNRWVVGYTYQMRQKGHIIRRKRPALVTLDLPILDDVLALSFVELMELRVIKVLLEKGIPLRRVRDAAASAIEIFNTSHPFASRRIFTDQKQVFAALVQGTEVPDIIELKKDRHLQILSGRLLQPVLEEISYHPDTSLADKWWPLSKSFPVVLNPKVAFGAPVVEGTGTRTEIVAAMAEATSPEVAANVYRVTKRQVEASIQFEDLLAA